MEQLLLENHKNFGGKYVAKKSFSDVEVISAADTPQAVHAEAKEKGIDDPVIFFVPKEGMVHIY
jgi:hypothetical protein